MCMNKVSLTSICQVSLVGRALEWNPRGPQITSHWCNVSSLSLQKACSTYRTWRQQFRFRLFIQFLPLWSMDDKVEAEPTRMHSSTMRTARSLTASRNICGWGGVAACPGEGHTCPPDRILDTRLWKHYLPATSVAGGKNAVENTITNITNFVQSGENSIKAWTITQVQNKTREIVMGDDTWHAQWRLFT